jgi:hypothetical protein
MFDELKKYQRQGHFFFKPDDDLFSVSTIPDNVAGVYYIFKLALGKVRPVYIGSSGKMQQNGKLKIRDGGLKDRLINGKQFDLPRKKSWPIKMIKERIDALDIYWWVTFNEKHRDIPTYVEGIILQRFYELYGCLPEWNNEF